MLTFFIIKIKNHWLAEILIKSFGNEVQSSESGSTHPATNKSFSHIAWCATGAEGEFDVLQFTCYNTKVSV